MAAASLGDAGRIDSLLSLAVERHGSEPAVSSAGAELDYRGLSLTSDRLAERMLQVIRSGVGGGADLRGARVAVVAPNVPAFVVALFAVSRLQAVVVPLSARLREHEVRQILEDAEPMLVLSVPAHLGYSFVDLLARLLPGLPTVRSVLLLGALGDVEGEIAGTGVHDAEPLDEEVAAILYTSGSTGAPRGALVAHAREVSAACHLASVLRLAPAERTVLVVPISHAFGFTCLLATAAAGGCAVLVQSTFSPRPLLTALEEQQASVLHGTPALFASLLEARPQGLPPGRGFVAGASPAPGLLDRLDRAGFGVLNLYGLTEAGAVSCCRPDDPATARHATAGRPLPGFDVRIGEPVPSAGGLGELEIRGGAVTRGYYGRPDETAAAFRPEGWFRTGDLATIEDGYLRIAGRLKELVNVAGFNVFPAEVEAVLLEHPDVAEAAVVGVRDERMGEALRAFVVARPGAAPAPAQLLAFARERIAGYKLPYSIQIVRELPLLPSGKPDRRALATSAAGAPTRRAGG
jgi:acyl-CoA synthetase (AMP-forming)/AMP-acid ligase II